MPARNRLGWAASLLVVAAVVAVVLQFSPPSAVSQDSRLVVYCAHDREFAEEILREFQRQTGIVVDVRYDTEATKSLGLVNRLMQERDHPQCDVFWNNELLGTCQLHGEAMLQPYRGPGFARIPERYREPEGFWVGFAARLRVYIVNTDRGPADAADVEQRLAGAPDLTRVAIAKPLFGTTLTHYTLLWHVWGADTLREWHATTRHRGIREVAGNAASSQLVADGACDFGFTDTDDFFVARDAGKPVAMLPVRIEGKTICIPNSVAIIRGAPHKMAAERLVDFLLSEESELRLAKSAARQIPLGPVSEELVPEDVRPLRAWAADGADLRPLLPARQEVILWLKSESLR